MRKIELKNGIDDYNGWKINKVKMARLRMEVRKN